MAALVELIVIPHDPTLPEWVASGNGGAPYVAEVAEEIGVMRQRLAQAHPDALIVIGSDHLNQWFLDNMPAFLVGKATRVAGPFPDEEESWGLARYDVPSDARLARELLRGGLERGIDFAYSDDFLVDHGFTIPLMFVRPEQDLPVVPVFTNVMAPPVAPGRRFFVVGGVLRDTIEAYESDQRIAVVTSCHMSNGVGGPKMLKPDAEWDNRMWGLIQANAIAEVVAASNWDDLYAIGNGTPGFLDLVCALGLARGAAPSRSRFVANPQGPANVFLEWDEAALDGVGA